jgi:phage-related minor tail protein
MANVIANDTLQGLPGIGSDLGSFLTNLAPGVGAFIIIMAILGGIGALIYAIVSVIKRKLHT